MSFEGLHESAVKDIIDTIKDGISSAEDAGFSFKSNRSLAKSSSLSKATEGLILVFPTLCPPSISKETAGMITRCIERKAISLLQIAFSAFNITNCEDAVSFVRQFHTNIGSGKMSIDKFMDAMDSIPTSESASMYNGIDRTKVRKVLEEFKQMPCYFEEDLSESSINDYKVINQYGNMVVMEAPIPPKRFRYPPGPDATAFPDDDYDTIASTRNRDSRAEDELDLRRWDNRERQNIERTKIGVSIAKNRQDKADADRKYNLDREKFDHQKDQDTTKNQLDQDKYNLDRDKYNLDRDKFANMQSKDAHDIAKDNINMIQNQMLPTDYKKANEMIPSMMVINFTVTPKDGNLQVPIYNQAVIGVKARLYEVSSDDVINKILVKNADNNVFLKLMRVSTKEISFIRDFLFAIDDAKLAAISCSTKGSETNKLLKVLERRALKGKIRRKLNMNNIYKAITTLIISREEADYIKRYKNIDLYKPQIIRKIMESLNLMMFIIADESEEYINLIMDSGEDMYETISFTFLERESADGSYKKAINLMTKVVR